MTACRAGGQGIAPAVGFGAEARDPEEPVQARFVAGVRLVDRDRRRIGRVGVRRLARVRPVTVSGRRAVHRLAMRIGHGERDRPGPCQGGGQEDREQARRGAKGTHDHPRREPRPGFVVILLRRAALVGAFRLAFFSLPGKPLPLPDARLFPPRLPRAYDSPRAVRSSARFGLPGSRGGPGGWVAGPSRRWRRAAFA